VSGGVIGPFSANLSGHQKAESPIAKGLPAMTRLELEPATY